MLSLTGSLSAIQNVSNIQQILESLSCRKRALEAHQQEQPKQTLNEGLPESDLKR